MKKFLGILVLCLIICSKSFAIDVSDQLLKLEGLYSRGSITKEEFLKAKSILLKIDLTVSDKIEKIKENLDKPKKEEFIIRKFASNVGTVHFEKMEMIFGDYRIYTHRPGGVKIRRLSDGKQLVVLSDKFIIKYYNGGEGIFDFKLDEEKKKISMKLNGVEVLHWEGRHVEKHRAHFFQMLVLGEQPFHFYIVLDGGRPAALNMAKFNRKIELAVSKVKIELASRFNITQEQIELILKRKKQKITSELDKAVQEKRDEILKQETQDAIDETLRASINQEIAKELEATIGKAMADEFVAAIEKATGEAIDSALSAELAAAIDQAVAEAVSEGISEAAASAGIQAYLDAMASGKSEQQAYDEGCAAAGLESGC